MKANELMVGNWVLWKGKPVQVARVSGVVYEFGHIDVTLAHCNDNGFLESHDIKSISPIPLTDEILEKNGFVFVDGYGCMRWMDEEGSRNGGREVLWSQLTRVLQIRAEGVCLDFFGCYCFHELQNILTVMKIGKEIKP